MELGCDAVRVVASCPVKGNNNTAAYTSGAGNLFAQEALVRNWLTERETTYAMGVMPPESPEE